MKKIKTITDVLKAHKALTTTAQACGTRTAKASLLIEVLNEIGIKAEGM